MFCIQSFFSDITNNVWSFSRKEHQIQQLEVELDQEHRMAESLVEDMVRCIIVMMVEVMAAPLMFSQHPACFDQSIKHQKLFLNSDDGNDNGLTWWC